MIRFLHIPKTAGTSLVEMLDREYVRGAALRFELVGGLRGSDLGRYAELPETDRSRIVVFCGHAPIRTGIPEADNCPIITMLRHPVARVKSFCQHVFEGKSPYLVERFPPDRFDLDAFLGSGNAELSNLAARMLLSSAGDVTAGAVDGRAPDEAADQALQVLRDTVAVFGIQELFDESIVMFAERLEWHRPWYRRGNVRSGRRLLSFLPRHEERIRSLNAVDLRLYDAARQLFLERLAACRQLPGGLRALRWRNRLHRWPW